MRGVEVEVGQRHRVQAWRGYRWWCSPDSGTGAACCCDCWAAARQPHSGLELRRDCCELCWRVDERAVVGMHVCHGCRVELWTPGLQRQGARRAGIGVGCRHDGRHCVRGVGVEVGLGSGVQAERWDGRWNTASGSELACCCDCWAAARQLDASLELRCRWCYRRWWLRQHSLPNC